MDEQPKISLSRRIALCGRMLGVAWSLRPGMVCGYFVGALLEIAGSIMTIYATAKLGALLAAFVAHQPAPHIWFWLYVDIAAAMVIALGFFVMKFASRLLYFAFTRWSTKTFMTAMCTIDIPNFYDEKTRNQINKVSGSYTWQLSNLCEANLDLIYGIGRFVAMTAVVAQITWWIVPLIALFLIPTLAAESRMAKLQWFVWDAKGDQRHVFWGLDYIIKQAKSQMELRSLQASKYVLRKIENMNEDFYQEQERTFRRANGVVLPTKILEILGTGIGSIVLLRQILSGALSLDRYFFLSGALFRVSGALNNVFGTVTRMQDSLLFADSYFTLVDTQATIIDNPEAVQIKPSDTPEITFENVSFSYPGQDRTVFENLSLHIPAGQHIALVGENGTGKSTLIKLLLRFYRPTSGRILINGYDLNDIAIDSWYEHLATLFQDFNQYPLPIDENIQIGRSTEPVHKDALKEAASLSGVDTMVSKYKHGWNTVLDSSFKQGVEPSGGQWQRVAIARAFYRRANVIILDEPTSAIDAQAEYHIFNSIFEQYRHKTALIVSHRFSTVRKADRIVVLEHGKIKESGTHTELLKQAGLYAEMFNKQAEGYR